MYASGAPMFENAREKNLLIDNEYCDEDFCDRLSGFGRGRLAECGSGDAIFASAVVKNLPIWSEFACLMLIAVWWRYGLFI